MATVLRDILYRWANVRCDTAGSFRRSRRMLSKIHSRDLYTKRSPDTTLINAHSVTRQTAPTRCYAESDMSHTIRQGGSQSHCPNSGPRSRCPSGLPTPCRKHAVPPCSVISRSSPSAGPFTARSEHDPACGASNSEHQHRTFRSVAHCHPNCAPLRRRHSRDRTDRRPRPADRPLPVWRHRVRTIPNTQAAHWVPGPAAVYRCVSAYLGDEVRLDGDVPDLVPRTPSSADLHSGPRMPGPAGVSAAPGSRPSRAAGPGRVRRGRAARGTPPAKGDPAP
jgi:hypothetical protein